MTCFHEKLALASLLAARGDDRGAADLMDRWIWSEDAYTTGFVLAVLERGRVAERLQDRARALQCYRFVAAAWRQPDAELVPYAREARDAVARLEGR
jgi:hypothetical protein